MGKWNNFFLQRMGTGKTGSENPVYESVSEWDVWCKAIPFKTLDKVKAPAKRTWYDEHGDDEYISPDGLFLEAYTMKVEFCSKAQDDIKVDSNGNEYVNESAQSIVRRNVKSFLDYLRVSGMMKLYSSWTLTGRQNVRLDSVGDNATWKQGEDGCWFLIFEVTFKVNDPVTNLTLNDQKTSIILDVND